MTLSRSYAAENTTATRRDGSSEAAQVPSIEQAIEPSLLYGSDRIWRRAVAQMVVYLGCISTATSSAALSLAGLRAP